MGFTFGKACVVGSRPAFLEEFLFDQSPRPRREGKSTLVVSLAEQFPNLFTAGDFGFDSGRATGDEKRLSFSRDFDLAIAAHCLRDLLRDTWREGELRVLLQCVEDLFSRVACGPGIPQPQSSDAVGVHVLGRSLEFSEHRESVTSRISEAVVNFEEDSPVALNDEGTVGIHNQPVYGARLTKKPPTMLEHW